MKSKAFKRAPVLLAVGVLVLVCGIQLLHLDFLERLERITYDLRVRTSVRFPAPAATNLAFVAMEDSSIVAVKNGSLGYQFGLYWPRQVYGRLIEELSAQGARAIAFDVLFGEVRNDHPPVQMGDGRLIESDDFFALQEQRAGNVLIAITPELRPPDLFATNAFALGGVSTDRDTDGTLRRFEAFHIYHRWHPLLTRAAAEFGLDLDRAQFAAGEIRLPQNGTTNLIAIPVDANGCFKLADFIGDTLPAGMAPVAKAYTDERVWSLGIALAAQELKLDLARADIDLARGRIILSGTNGVRRVIPVDAQGYGLIDWRLTPRDDRLLRAPVESLLRQERLRLQGRTNSLRDDFRGKLVVIGSTAQGNDLTDRGATPLEKDTFLVSKHWNVANSVITGQFIRRAPQPVELALILFLGAVTATLTWRLRAVAATGGTFLLMAAYVGVAFFAFVQFHYWLPLVLPLVGAVLVEHVSLVTYRMVFEEREQRRVKSVFSKIVSPEVVNELLQAEKLSLGGARREVTILFADVRGFTTFTDEAQQRVEEFVRTHQLGPEAAKKCFDDSAREILDTVNLYLAAVADAVKNHGGTLDKYIGDCVMAFWNAPIANERHGPACVRAAIEAQGAIHCLNQMRREESAARELESPAQQAAARPPRAPLAALQLGTGIHTGLVTVGLMGSDTHILNYTIFGREVNLASRLEGVSGSGRILISDATHRHLQRRDPDLAATCVALPPVLVKGFRDPVGIYEVPWPNK
jgi:class 3 adenylate cyclase/CHASE2 domain-containing sensor protein